MDSVRESKTMLDDDESVEEMRLNVQELDKTLAQASVPELPPRRRRRCTAHTESGFGPSAREKSKELLGGSGRTEFVPVASPKPYHHHNFWRSQEPIKNDTDPAVSLAILTSPMKGFMAASEFEHEPRKHVVAWNAHRLLDPVVYAGDFNLLCRKRISERRDLAVGEVFKFYTQSGSWQWEPLGQDDPAPMVDHELMDQYPTGYTIVNGFVGDKGQPTHASMGNSMLHAAKVSVHRRKASARKRSSDLQTGSVPSPLQLSYTPKSMVAEEQRDQARMMAERRVSRAIRGHITSLMPQSFARSWADLDSDSDSDSSDD